MDRATLAGFETVDYMPFDPIVKRTEGTVRCKSTGETFKCTKGAPHVIAELLEGADAAAIQAEVRTAG